MSVERYTRTAIGLHWLMFLLIAWGFSVGLSMVDLPLSPAKLKYYSWHKWIGVTVFLLAVTRVVWRLRHPAPPLPATMAAWQKRVSDAVHRVLYALILVIPLTGWLYSSAEGVPTVYLGLVQLPDVVPKDKSLADLLKRTHVTLNFTLLALVVVHGAAAVKHHFIDRDDVLARMLPLVKPKG
jgi:cytochrome b561